MINADGRVVKGCIKCGQVCVALPLSRMCLHCDGDLYDKKQLRHMAVRVRRQGHPAFGRVLDKVADACQAVEESTAVADRYNSE